LWEWLTDMKTLVTPRHVAIVGCGFTGTSALYQLVTGHPVSEITLFDASGQFGPGYPYRPDECPAYLLNNTTDTLGVDPANRRGFADWLEATGSAPGFDPSGHLPRRLFGTYLQAIVTAARTMAEAKGIKVNLVASEVLGVRELGSGLVEIRFEQGAVTADAVILSTGRCPNGEPLPPAGSATYIHDHVSCQDIDRIPGDAKVHILGASLSAYDVINRLFSPESGCAFRKADDGKLRFDPGSNRRSVVLCSRSGRMKSAQSRHPLKALREPALARLARVRSPGGGSLSGVAGAVVALARDQRAEVDWRAFLAPYADCRSQRDLHDRAGELLRNAIDCARSPGGNFLVDLYSETQTDVWDLFASRFLAPGEEVEYRRNWETAVLGVSAPCPLETLERILALYEAGRLTVIKGISGVRADPDRNGYVLDHEFGSEFSEVLVNVTGTTDRDVMSDRQPALTKDLVDQGLLRPHMLGEVKMPGAAVDLDSMLLPGSSRIYLASMLLWGPGFFVSSAFMMATIVRLILSDMFGSADAIARNESPERLRGR